MQDVKGLSSGVQADHYSKNYSDDVQGKEKIPYPSLSCICKNGLPLNYNLIRFVLHNPAGVNISHVLLYYAKLKGISLKDVKDNPKIRHREYMSLMRFMNVLDKEGLIRTEKQRRLREYLNITMPKQSKPNVRPVKPKKLIFYHATPKAINFCHDVLTTLKNLKNQEKTADMVDLIEACSKTQTRRCQIHKTEKKAVLDEIDILMRKFRKKRHYAWENVQFLKKYNHLNPFGLKVLNEGFKDYKDDVADKKLIFGKDNLSKWIGKRGVKGYDKYMAMPYVHRFEEDKIMEKIKEYNKIWNNVKSNCGVHLTTTFEGGSIGEISGNVYKFFNNLMSYIPKHRIAEYRRRFGKDVFIPDWLKHRPVHIKVVEFQGSFDDFKSFGRLHLHIVIFGVRHIADKKTELTPELIGIGFGKINFIYQIKRIHGNRWVYAHPENKPKDCEGNNVQSHLKKYLEKALVEHEKIALYWLTDKRFFTYSLRLRVKRSRDKVVAGVVVPEGWFYIGVWCVWDMPNFIMDNLINIEEGMESNGYG